MRDADTRRGILLMIAGSFFFALTMLCAKLLSPVMGAVEVTFWRNAIGLPLLLASLLHRPMDHPGGRPLTLVFRGVIGTFALLAFFYTVAATTLSHAIIYAKTEPIFTAILAFFLLGEKLTARAAGAVLLGFAGVAVISGLTFAYLDVMGILTGLLAAFAYTSVRSLKAFYDERAVVLSFMISGVAIPAAFMAAAAFYRSEILAFALSPFVVPGGTAWLWITLMGVFAAFGQLYMTRAYFYAKAGIVSTASYSVVLFATLLGLALGDVVPDPAILTGGALIVAGGILLAREK